jgi:hypothetical protein
MARKPAAPPPSGGADLGRERFGPLALERMAKDDGRALIVYSHEEHDERQGLEERERA